MTSLRKIAAATAITTATLSFTAAAALPGPAHGAEPFGSRITARWNSITDSSGRVWGAGVQALGTGGNSQTLVGKDVAGTTEDALYQVNSFGVKSYSLAVPQAGSYQVRLLMAEDWYSKAGERVFDVTAEGGAKLRGIDIAAAVGKARAYDRTFAVDVTDGRLDLGWVARVGNPLVSAIEVTYAGPASGGTTGAGQPVVTRLTAHAAAVKDGAGQVWAARSGLVGVQGYDTYLAGKDVAGTTDDVLYDTTAWGVTAWSTPVPAAGSYQVRLLLSEGYFGAAGKRVFDVTAEGATLLKGVDVFAAVGKGRAYDRTFTTTVRDGRLDVGFVSRADQPAIAGIEVRAVDGTQTPAPTPSPAPAPTPSPTPAPTSGTRAVRFAPNSFFTTSVRNAPVAANSSKIVAHLLPQIRDNWNGVASFATHSYNVSFHTVPPGHPRTRMGFWDCQGKNYLPWGLYDGPAHYADVPIPSDAVSAAGTDAEMTIYDPGADKIWEFWATRKNPSTGVWEACWGGRLDNVSASQGYFPMYFGATATGIVAAGGMVTIDEVKRGEINHAMSLNVIEPKAGAFSWPAQRTDGWSKHPDAIQEGQRLRLDPSVDVDSLELTPVGRMVAKAAQEYGFVVIDKSGAVGLNAEAGALTKKRTGVDPWDTMASPSYEVLRNFPWERMQVLPVDHGKP